MSDFLDFLRKLLFRIQHKVSITEIVTALSNRPVTLGDCQPSHPRGKKRSHLNIHAFRDTNSHTFVTVTNIPEHFAASIFWIDRLLQMSGYFPF